MSMNYLLADFCSILTVASKSRLKLVYLKRNRTFISILDILYRNGAIKSFVLEKKFIRVYLKYLDSFPVMSEISLVSRPENVYF